MRHDTALNSAQQPAGGRAPAGLSVLSTLSAKEALKEIIPLFELATGYLISVEYVGASVLATRQISGGEADLFIGPCDLCQRYAAAGILMPDSQRDFAVSRSGAAVRSGGNLPDIASPEGLVAYLRQARSVCYGAGASATQFVSALHKYGLHDEIAAKRVVPAPGEAIGAIVSRGDATLGIQQVSELMPIGGITLLKLPAEFEKKLTYCAASFSQSQALAGVDAFIRFLGQDDASSIFRRKGLEPL
ncbi:MAG: substrate-binding domain-containing protein [Pseudomonadota bacterium]